MNRLSTRKAGLVVCLGLMAAAILLMALPLGVPLTFAPGPDIRTRKTFAFFDLSVWGMSGNVFPFLTAVLSVVVFFLLLWILLRPRELGKRETVSQVLAFLLVFGTILSMMMAGGATVVGVLDRRAAAGRRRAANRVCLIDDKRTAESHGSMSRFDGNGGVHDQSAHCRGRRCAGGRRPLCRRPSSRQNRFSPSHPAGQRGGRGDYRFSRRPVRPRRPDGIGASCFGKPACAAASPPFPPSPWRLCSCLKRAGTWPAASTYC